MANEANIKINGDASGLVRATTIAQGALSKLSAEMTALEQMSGRAFSLIGLSGIGLSAGAAAASLVAATKSAAEYGDELAKLSKRTGESVENLSKLQYAAKLSDVSNEVLAKGLKNLAGQIVSATHGVPDSVALFDKFGIAVRDTDGKVRSTGAVLMDFADVFAEMADGPEKAAMASEIFGAKLGTELIPLLNEGREGIKKLGDEAERFGLVISDKQAAAAEEFSDNIDRLKSRSQGAAISIGNILIPSISRLINEFNAGMDSSNGFLDALLKFGLTNPFKDKAQKARELANEISALEDKISIGRGAPGDNKRLEELQKELAYYQKISGEKEEIEAESAKKRKNIALQLAGELAKLEKLRAIAAGEASADILKDDKTRTAEQIKEAEKLRDALKLAWETSRKEAQAAAEDAVKLMEKAQSVRTSAKDKADSMRESGLSAEEKAAAALARAQDAQGQGEYYAAAAAAAKLDGRAADFERYQKQAEAFLDRAAKFAEQSGDANLVEQIGNEQAALLEQQAKAKKAQADALNAQAEGQVALLKKVEEQLDALQKKASAIEIKFQIEEASGKISELQTKLDALRESAGQPVTPPAQPAADAAQPSYSGGGYTGRGGKYEPAGIVHRDEFVVNSERTAEPGALDFLWRFHRLGMSALKGYAEGGFVGNQIDIPIPNMTPQLTNFSGGSGGGTPVVLDFSKLGAGRHTVMARDDVAETLVKVFQQAAWARGRK